MFRFQSQELPLNLINTQEMKRGKLVDHLQSVGNLKLWIEEMNANQLLEGYCSHIWKDTEIARAWLEEALPVIRDFRALLRKGLEAIADHGALGEGWVASLEEALEKAPLTFKYSGSRLDAIPVEKGPPGLISVIAYQTLTLYAEGKLQSVRRCSNPKCIWLFMDSTGKRKWCSMKICGNRMKAERHKQSVPTK
ncbi:CGNR zinc finger domain-containing protein [Paenibacillus medicaginis]|uniref:CGNR zinc finger domain-containing protein n=1 Tax=Paenibacillus medicaginis TaxID=1470560 RepID=A0ABV5C0F7_9BACL